MGIYTTKPVKELSSNEWSDLIRDRLIIISPHALDHISLSPERKVFKEAELKHTLERESPRRIYLQENSRYCAYYRKSEGYRKLIIDCVENTVTVVSFMDTPELPKVDL